MKARWITGMVSALLVLSMSLALAQGQGRRGGGLQQGGLQLLRIEEVQKELKMTPEQVAKLDAKQQEVRTATQAARGANFQQQSPEERAKANEKIREIQTKAVNEILDATQQKRFRQLELQQAGPSAVTRKDVADELKLTEEQVTKIREIQTKMQEETRAARQGVDFQDADARTKMTEKVQEIQKTSGEKVVALLTDKQKEQWKGMLGESFKFPPPMPRRRNP